MSRHLWGALFALLALPGLSMAMEALDDRELGEVSGAGVGFFLDDFYYDQGSASAQVSGLKDSQGNALTVDLERAYIKGDGSQRGALDSPAAVYAVQQYIDWLKRYAPPEAQQMTFNQAGNVAARRARIGSR